MSVGWDYMIIILGMALVTYTPRWFPFFFLADRRVPEIVVEWLDLIPAAILSALLVPALIVSGEPRQLDLLRPEMLVAVPTLLFAIKTRSLGGTVLVGMVLFALAQKFM